MDMRGPAPKTKASPAGTMCPPKPIRNAAHATTMNRSAQKTAVLIIGHLFRFGDGFEEFLSKGHNRFARLETAGDVSELGQWVWG